MSADAELRLHDERARRVACEEFRRPILVEAGAGTGKTSVLVARIVAWCIGPGYRRNRDALASGRAAEEGEPDPVRVAGRTLSRIAAITFTEAAAAEMAERVGVFLRAVAEGGSRPGLDLTGLGLDEDERRRRARACLECLDRLQIGTIHAFCRRLLARHALAAGLHPAFEVDAEGAARRRWLRRVLGERLEAVYQGEGDPALRELLREGGGSADGIDPSELEDALAALLDAAAPAALLEADPFDLPRVQRFAAELRAEVERLEEALRPLAGIRRLRKPAALVSGLVELRAVLDGLASPDRDERLERLEGLRDRWKELAAKKTLENFRRGRFPETASRVIDPAELVALGQAAASALGVLSVLEKLAPRRLELLRKALAPVLAEVRSALRREGVVAFEDLLREADRLLRERPEVLAAERRGLDQLLVDEFQDTDPVQCQVVGRLALEGPDGDRPGLFLVGDPKQSIYAFRGADLRAYDEMADRIRAEGGEVVRLHVNFRSAPPILEEVERCLERVLRYERGVQAGFEPLVPAPERADDAGFRAEPRAPVEHWILTDPELSDFGRAREAVEAEAAWVARDIRELVAGPSAGSAEYRDVAILLRSLGDLPVVERELQHRDIPYQVGRDRNYFRQREVLDLAALVRAILDPRDQVALVAALRSPLGGVPDAAWIPLFRRGFPGRCLRLHGGRGRDLEALSDMLREVALELREGKDAPELPAFEITGTALLAAIGDLRARWRELAPPALAERIRTDLLVDVSAAGRFPGRFRAAHVDRFLAELADLLEESGGDAGFVLRELRRRSREPPRPEEARSSATEENAVFVGTIHGAKGLEFPHVYLMQTQRGSWGGGPPSTYVEPGPEPEEYRLLGAPTLGIWRVEAWRKRVDEAEVARLLYVALTRAKHRLVISGAHPKWGGLGDLLKGRRPAPEAVRDAATRAGVRPGHTDLAGARVVLPALWPEEPDAARERGDEAGQWPGEDAIQSQESALRDRRAEAARRASRPRGGRASEEDHGPLAEPGPQPDPVARAGAEEGSGDGGEAGPTAAIARPEAQAVGAAVHRALEELDLAASDPVGAIEGLRPVVRASLVAAGAEAAGLDVERAEARAVDLLRGFARGPLGRRLREIGPHVVARELPLLLRPAPGEEPLEFVAGVADLVYRDREGGALVVVDFKTDAVEDPAELRARAEAYRAQGARYTRALAEALELGEVPRFELWFLAAGRILDLGPGAGAPAAGGEGAAMV